MNVGITLANAPDGGWLWILLIGGSEVARGTAPTRQAALTTASQRLTKLADAIEVAGVDPRADPGKSKKTTRRQSKGE